MTAQLAGGAPRSYSGGDMKTIRRLAFIVLATAVLGLGACGKQAVSTPDAPTAAVAAKAPLLVNITSGKNDLHAVSMALGLAKMAAEHGHQVVVFLNVEAPIFATKDLAADVRFADFPPVSELVAGALAKGAKIIVCGHCAAVQKVDTSQLLPGVIVSDHGQLLDYLQPGMIGVSY
ncbi:MAG TPA: DsrE family protein [Kofleriaceae bacterium]|nr:DsrE family protein [Kofleriaceae bacterium]